MLPHEFTVVVVDTFPTEFLGVQFNERFGIRPVFYKEEKTGIPFFQASVFLQILDHATKRILFEFRTATDFKTYEKIQDHGFFELIHSHILAAIDGFNWHLKRKKSDFTFDKAYSPLPTFEQNKEAVRKAYTLSQFDYVPTNN